MSANPPTTPIYELDHDVLLCIFSHNGDMFTNGEALDTTRFTSQVCRQWRDLMLETPSLWAKLIDMDSIYRRRTDEWRNELIQRSGTAPLWIKADLLNVRGILPRNIEYFFYYLIIENMHRIQKLVMSEHSTYSVQLTPSMFAFPAPLLEFFSAPGRWITGAFDSHDQTEALFADDAPLLHSTLLSSHPLHHKASWLSHLHNLVLDVSYDIPDALAVLSAAHNLQTLKIVDICNANGIPLLCPTIVFISRLKFLEFIGHCTGVGSLLLMYIDIPLDCSISIRLRNFDNREHLIERKSPLFYFIDTFTRHTERRLRFQNNTYMNLGYEDERITLVFETTLPVKWSMSISVQLPGDSDAHFLEMFLKQLLALDLKSVRKLKFTADTNRLNPYFALLFSRLSSVESISVSLKTLTQLAHLQNKFICPATKKPRILFPMLNIIYITLHSRSQPHKFRQPISFINQAIVAFLLLRLREGYPITLLNLSKHYPLNTPLDLRALSEVKGLTLFYILTTFQGVVEHAYGRFGERFQYHFF